MGWAYAITNALAGLGSSAFTAAAGPANATRAYLNDSRLSAQYAFTANASSNTLTIDLGSATALVGLAILNHNLATATSPAVSIQAADDSGISSGVVTAKSNSTINQTAPQHKDTVLQFASVNKRYWRINFGWTGTFTLKIGELFAYTAATQPTRQPIYGSGEAEEYKVAQNEMQYGEQRAYFYAGPIREQMLKWADHSATEKNALMTMWRAAKGPINPILYIPSYEAVSTAAAAAEQDCLFGRLQLNRMEWKQSDYNVYQEPDFIIRSLGREVGA